MLEYVESLPSPTSVSSIPHPDWISSITHISASPARHHNKRSNTQSYIITGCYDGTLRCYDAEAVIDLSGSSHDDALLCAGIGHISSIQRVASHRNAELADADSVQPHQLLASVGKDRTVRLWKLSADTGMPFCHQIAEGQSVASLASVELNGNMVSAWI